MADSINSPILFCFFNLVWLTLAVDISKWMLVSVCNLPEHSAGIFIRVTEDAMERHDMLNLSTNEFDKCPQFWRGFFNFISNGFLSVIWLDLQILYLFLIATCYCRYKFFKDLPLPVFYLKYENIMLSFWCLYL